ncbi:tRNA-binding protein [Chryseobacterium sp. VAUSW3]|uniref:tRNA-binding protein n=1 Tax=Chryseobacterium sp. VAUSW3 TaxID=2010998 RepID=UPI000B4C2D2D|nr:tRNA-binding protein [Chryseobacterium sp. VAUSW3]OWR15418.1 tRNA-binding protein [Chryseobacterium sp. VAUSW3]
MDLKPEITWRDFEKLDIRCGTVISVADFPEAKKPSYRLEIDFGTLGIKKSSAQITSLYQKEELVGKQILAVVNFPKKQIANFFSECLVLGLYGENKDVTLITPSLPVKNGSILG